MSQANQETLAPASAELKIATPKSGPHLIIEYAFAIGTAGFVVAIYAAIIVRFLRWALGQ